jgi:phosphonate transport system substrate-binding protein
LEKSDISRKFQISEILITSIQAPNADFVCEAIARYLSQKMGQTARFVAGIPWQERERQLDEGQIQLGWICSLPYILKVDRPDPAVELLAAAIMAAPRYRNSPIYFSDVVVLKDSPYQTFADLRGASWAFNEPNSQSGYNITRYHLATLGEPGPYFGRIIETGAHEVALEMVLNGEIDASAIDSTVLEIELASRPHIVDLIRIIDILGPSPIPPWVISKKVPIELRERIQQAFLTMHEDPAGRAVLKRGQMNKFTVVNDRDYDPIRHMARIAAPIDLNPRPR